MKALVTGGTGFPGTHLVRRLLSDGWHVRLFVRSLPRARRLIEEGAEVVEGDITDHSAIERALHGTDTVFHLAGMLFAPGVASTEYYRVHVEGTRTILECCREHAALRRLVHCSTTGVLGTTGEDLADENRPHAPTNSYERSKFQAEVLVVSASRGGLPATIIRPGLVYGPGDVHLLGLFQAIQRGFFRPIGSRAVRLHPIYVDDLVDSMVLAASESRAIGECFHVAGREPVTLEALSSAIASSLGVAMPHGTIPLFIAWIAATVAEVLPAGLRRHAPLTRSRLDFLTHSRAYDVSKAARILGFVAKTGLADGLAETVSWYRQMGYLSQPRQEDPATKKAERVSAGLKG